MLRSLGLRKGTTIHGYTLRGYQVVGRTTVRPTATPTAYSKGLGAPPSTRPVRYVMRWEPTTNYSDRGKLLTILTEYIDGTPITVTDTQWELRVVDHIIDPIGGEVIVCAEALPMQE